MDQVSAEIARFWNKKGSTQFLSCCDISYWCVRFLLYHEINLFPKYCFCKTYKINNKLNIKNIKRSIYREICFPHSSVPSGGLIHISVSSGDLIHISRFLNEKAIFLVENSVYYDPQWGSWAPPGPNPGIPPFPALTPHKNVCFRTSRTNIKKFKSWDKREATNIFLQT